MVLVDQLLSFALVAAYYAGVPVGLIATGVFAEKFRVWYRRPSGRPRA